jgi:putative transcriptional regulator
MKNRLKVLRAERGWNQSDLAEKLSVSRQTINAIETERYDPSLPLAFAISHLFGTADRADLHKRDRAAARLDDRTTSPTNRLPIPILHRSE